MCDSKIMTVKVQRSIWGSPAVLIYNKDKSFCKEYPFDKIFNRIMGNSFKGYFKVKIESDTLTVINQVYGLDW